MANRLEPGDSIRAVVNGRYKSLRIVGVGHLAGVHLRAGAGPARPGQPPLRHPVDGPQGARHRLRHRGRLQRRHRQVSPGRLVETVLGEMDRILGRLRRRRRLRPRGPALAPLPLGRDRAEPHDVAHHADDLPRGGRVPALHHPHAAGADAALAGGAAQGVRLLRGRDRAALPQLALVISLAGCGDRASATGLPFANAMLELYAEFYFFPMYANDRCGPWRRRSACRSRWRPRPSARCRRRCGRRGSSGGIDAPRAAAALPRRRVRALGPPARAQARGAHAGAQPRAPAASLRRQRRRHRHRRGPPRDDDGDDGRRALPHGVAVHRRAARGRAGAARGAARRARRWTRCGRCAAWWRRSPSASPPGASTPGTA